MLLSYQAVNDHGQIRWLTDNPPVDEACVIVTMLSPQFGVAPQTCRAPATRIAGKGRILGNGVEPVAPEGDWDALK